jgi:hypothetical protein
VISSLAYPTYLRIKDLAVVVETAIQMQTRGISYLKINNDNREVDTLMVQVKKRSKFTNR